MADVLTDRQIASALKRILYVLVLMHCNHDFKSKTLDTNLNRVLTLVRKLEVTAFNLDESRGRKYGKQRNTRKTAQRAEPPRDRQDASEAPPRD